MATSAYGAPRKPLVLNAGQQQQIQPADTLAIPGNTVSGTTVSSGATNTLVTENLASTTGTTAYVAAETGTASAFTLMENIDGSTPTGEIATGIGDTNGLTLATAAGNIVLEPAPATGVAETVFYNPNTTSSTKSEVEAATGTVGAYTLLTQSDGATLNGVLSTGSGDTNGMTLLTGAGPLILTPATSVEISTITGSTQCLQVNSSGVISGTGAGCGGGGGSGTVTSIATNNGITGGTITTTGTIGLASQTANTMLGNWSASSAVPTAQAMPSCADSGGNHLNYVSGTGISCGTSDLHTGTVTTTGSPATGNLSKFSGSTSITNGDLSGDCTTSGTLAITCAKTSGTAFGTFATQNYATPPAIGGGTPAAGRFTALTATGNTVSGTTANGGGTNTLDVENLSSTASTEAYVAAVTGTASAFTLMANIDGVAPSGLIESAVGDTGGLTIATAIGNLILTPAPATGVAEVEATNLATTSTTKAEIAAVTGTTNAFTLITQSDGSTLSGVLSTGAGDTNGLELLAGAGPINIAPASGHNMIFSTAIQAGGSIPANTGSCAINTQVGGTTAGSFKANGACAGGTIILALGTAPVGWACQAADMTTPADTIKETAYSTTKATFTATMAGSDQAVFQCVAF